LILRRALFYIAAAAAMAAASAVAVFAAAFALYAWMCDFFRPAGAAAVVVGAAALLLLLAGVAAAMAAGLGRREPTLAERAADFARDKPIAALLAALAGGIVAVRNPKTLVAILAAFLEPKRRRKS